MLQRYVIRNYFKGKDVGEMLYDHSKNEGTIEIYDMENSCYYMQVVYPSGKLNKEQTDKLIKYRVIPPDRQCMGSFMKEVTGRYGCAYDPYALFFHNEGRLAQDYLEFIKKE